MSWVLDNSPYEGKARLIHVVLADHANDDGFCWPSQSTIARRAGCSVEHVRVTVKQMLADGFIKIIDPGTREGDPHRYQLVVPKSFGVPKSSGQPPQVDGPTSPNPSPSNRQEPSKNHTGGLASSGDIGNTGGDRKVRCPYCHNNYKTGKPHNCPAMNQLIR